MRHSHATVSLSLLLSGTFAASAFSAVSTTPTMNGSSLATALNPQGLSIKSVTIHNGVAGQFGTFTDFNLAPVTISDGIVMSSGSVADLAPIPGATLPDYDPASPPGQVNSQMAFDSDGGTPEFDSYGLGHIENFYASYDVAAIEVVFFIEEDSQVQFDFIFGSVEFPYWTSQFTDSFVVFLDSFDDGAQISFDSAGNPIQVGSSFAGLETTADKNTAFSDPHAVIHHLTTTTQTLDSGEHTLWFEVGDVNDHILDSAVFLSHLRTGVGDPGTEPTDECEADFNGDGTVDGADLATLLGDWGEVSTDDLDGVGVLDGADLAIMLGAWGDCP
ncbi:MAG: choice-of-anchor L domain-containing protein [Phycisphaerae bacterium]|nr:choice-of-anchor L domain-containing protein [Phycisphaerae bacterium]